MGKKGIFVTTSTVCCTGAWGIHNKIILFSTQLAFCLSPFHENYSQQYIPDLEITLPCFTKSLFSLSYLLPLVLMSLRHYLIALALFTWEVFEPFPCLHLCYWSPSLLPHLNAHIFISCSSSEVTVLLPVSRIMLVSMQLSHSS